MQIIKITKANEREALQGKEGSKQDFFAREVRTICILSHRPLRSSYGNDENFIGAI